MEQKSLQQHAFYCKNEVETWNLIDALRVTSAYSKEVKRAPINKMLQYLQRHAIIEQGANI